MKIHKILFRIYCLSVFFSTLGAYSFPYEVFDVNAWETIGQGGGGNIVDIVCHPTDPNIIWAVTDLTGLFRSTDGGISYDRMSGPVEKEELLFEWMRGLDHELAYDPSQPRILYWAMDGGIYTPPGLYKSVNGGVTWFKITGSPDLAPGAITVDPKGIIYGIKHKAFWVSRDKGKTWIEKPQVPTEYCGNAYDWRRRYRVFIYSGKSGTVYIGDRREGTGIFFSEDQGDSWINVLKGQEIMDVACSPVDEDLVMALEQDGTIFRSTDGGHTFEEVDAVMNSYYKPGTWPAYYGGIAINHENHVMAIGRRSLGFSTDGGKTFQHAPGEELNWDPGDYIFASRRTGDSLLKCNKISATLESGKWITCDGQITKVTNDNGHSWQAFSKGIDIICVYAPPVIDQTDPDIIHVPAGDIGHHYTLDGGQTWNAAESAMRNVDGIDQDPNNPSIFYKLYGRNRQSGEVHKSTDGGRTWRSLSRIPMPAFRNRGEHDRSFYSGWIGRLRVDPSNSARIYAMHRAADGLYMSEDSGHSFERILEVTRPWELEVTDSGTVFLCTWDSNGLYRSTDNGKSFEVLHDGRVHDFAVHPEDDNIIFINTGSFDHAWATARILPNYELNMEQKDPGKGLLLKTEDGGKTWRELGQYDGFALYIEPNYPEVMLMSTRDGGQGIMRSLDSGQSWHSIHGNHDNYHPRGFVYGGIPGRVYTWNHNLARIDGIHMGRAPVGSAIAFRKDLNFSESDQTILRKFIGYAVEFATGLTAEKVENKCRKAPEMFAWVEFRYLNCLNTAFELTGDTEYLDLLSDRFELFYDILSTGPDAYLGWYGSPIPPRIPKDNPDVQIDELQMTFRAISLLSKWVQLSRSDEDYAAQHQATIDRYLSLMENHLFPKWDARGHFREIENRGGVYRSLDFPSSGLPTLSFEKLSMMVDGCLKLYRVTGDDRYMRRALQVGAWFKSSLILKDNHYEWMSWMPAGRWDISPDKEDSWIPGWMAPDPNAAWYVASLSIALNLYQHGLLFDGTDLARFIRTQKSMCWNGDMEKPAYRNVAGESSKWIKGRFLSYQLSNYDPTLSRLAFRGPHEEEFLVGSGNSYQGTVVAHDYIREKILRAPLVRETPMPEAAIGKAFLDREDNRIFYKQMLDHLNLWDGEPPIKPSDLYPELKEVVDGEKAPQD